MLAGTIYSNNRLTLMGITTSAKCTYCEEPSQSRLHLIKECPEVRAIHSKLLVKLGWKENEYRSLVGDKNELANMFCIWILNQLIYQGNFIKEIKLTWEIYIARLRHIKGIEEFIAERDGKILNHLRKWEVIENLLNL